MPLSQQPASSKKILLVEDNPTESLGLMRMLEQNGYTVTPARDAFEAVRAVRAGQPDLVLLDINLPVNSVENPRWDGLDFMQWMHSATGDGIPVIIRSSTPLVATQRRCDHPQVVAYLQKPTSLQDLLAAIRSALDQGARTQDIRVA